MPETTSPPRPINPLAALPDRELLERLGALVVDSRRTMAELLRHLAEVDLRRLYREAACSSLFTYCTERLGFSEATSYRRITAARLGRRFPMVFDLLSAGRLHLAAIASLSPYLTPDNQAELLEVACGKTCRDLEVLLATRFPEPDVPTRIRKLPRRRAAPGEAAKSLQACPGGRGDEAAWDASHNGFLEAATTGRESIVRVPPPSHGPDTPSAEGPPFACELRLAHAVESGKSRRDCPVKPLSADRYRVQFTAPQALRDKLRRAEELCSRRVPPGDVPALIELALDVLIEREELRQGRGRTSTRDGVSTAQRERGRPAAGARPAPTGQRARVPRNVSRTVWPRDDERCTYVDQDGNRCSERRFLELDHIVPRARGGPPTEPNLRVRCRSHNELEAERAFGPEFIRRKVSLAMSPARKRK